MSLNPNERYAYNEDTDTHTWVIAANDQVVLTGEEFSEIIYAYVEAGEDKTQAQISEEFDLTAKQVSYVFRYAPVPVTKSSAPYTPAQIQNMTPKQLVQLDTARRKESNLRKKQEVRVKLLQQELDKAIDKREIANQIRDAILSTTTPVEFNVTRHQKNKERDSSVVFCFQDWHAGATCRVTNPFTGFDSSVFQSRINQCRNFIQNYKQTISQDKVSPTLLFNGDLLDDPMSQMHYDQQINQDTRGIEQIRMCAEAICTLVTAAVSRFPNQVVNVVALAGNHDRMTPTKDLDPERMGHWILWEIVRARLHGLLNAGVVVLDIPRRKSTCVMTCGKVRLLAWHGDQKMKPADIIQNDAICNSGYRVLVQGHNHKRIIQEGAGHMFVTMPSLMGASNYGEEWGYAYRPGQGVIEICNLGESFKVDVRFFDLD